MKKESLEKVKTEIINLLYNLDINPIDKGELAINLYHFLDVNKYESNIKALRQEDKPMKDQITIDEYVMTLRKENKNARGNN